MTELAIISDLDQTVYHLELCRRALDGAHAAILPGAPERAELIAGSLENPRKVASHRGLDSWTGYLDGHPVLVTNTGMGGPSMEIVLQELVQLGLDTFLRIGTTGSIQEDVPIGSLVISEAAIRLDGTSDHYAPPCYPAVADFDLTMDLVHASEQSKRPVARGLTVSTSSFYSAQERYDSAAGYVIRANRGSLEEWHSLGAINYEMEAGTLFTLCRTMGLKAAAICAVVAHRTQSEGVARETIRETEKACIEVALAGLSHYLNRKKES